MVLRYFCTGGKCLFIDALFILLLKVLQPRVAYKRQLVEERFLMGRY